MLVEVWSDVVCPWCYIGEHRFAEARARAAHGDAYEVVYRPFQLDPQAPRESQPVVDAYARKFGGPDAARAAIARVTEAAARDGLPMRLDHAQRANTFDAHRLIAWGLDRGHQATIVARLFRAYFVDGADVADRAVLADLASEAGLDHAAAADVLDSEAFVVEVQADLARGRDLGIVAVPSFGFGDFVLPGAQDPEVFTRILDKLAERAGS